MQQRQHVCSAVSKFEISKISLLQQNQLGIGIKCTAQQAEAKSGNFSNFRLEQLNSGQFRGLFKITTFSCLISTKVLEFEQFFMLLLVVILLVCKQVSKQVRLPNKNHFACFLASSSHYFFVFEAKNQLESTQNMRKILLFKSNTWTILCKSLSFCSFNLKSHGFESHRRRSQKP